MAVAIGTKLFLDDVKAKNKEPQTAIPTLIREIGQTKMLPEIQKQLGQIPQTRTRNRIFIYGGASWAIATFTHPEYLFKVPASNYVEITANDVHNFALQARQMNPASMDRWVMDYLAKKHNPSAENLKDVTTELARVRNVFKPDALCAAGEIFERVAAEVKLEQTKMFFSRQALYSGMYGYLMNKARTAMADAK